jgi:hypothetical protein
MRRHPFAQRVERGTAHDVQQLERLALARGEQRRAPRGVAGVVREVGRRDDHS